MSPSARRVTRKQAGNSRLCQRRLAQWGLRDGMIVEVRAYLDSTLVARLFGEKVP